MKTSEQWIDETPGTIEDEEHRADLIKLYKRIQQDVFAECAKSSRISAKLNVAIGTTGDNALMGQAMVFEVLSERLDES